MDAEQGAAGVTEQQSGEATGYSNNYSNNNTNVKTSLSQRALDWSLVLLQIKGSPERVEVHQFGWYSWNHPDPEKRVQGRQDQLVSVALVCLLLSISTLTGDVLGTGGFTSVWSILNDGKRVFEDSKRDLSLELSFCGNTTEVLQRSRKIVRKLSGVEGALYLAKEAKAALERSNSSARLKYKHRHTDGTVTRWPQPLKPDQETTDELFSRLREPRCYQRVCLPEVERGEGFEVNQRGKRLAYEKLQREGLDCFPMKVICPHEIEEAKHLAQARNRQNQEAQKLFLDMEERVIAEKQLLDQFQLNDTSKETAESFEDTVAAHLTALLARLSWAASWYIYYQVFCLLVGPAFAPFKPNFLESLRGMLNLLNQPRFVAVIIVLLYFSLYLGPLLEPIRLELDFYLPRLSVSWCWMDFKFVAGLSDQISEACSDKMEAMKMFQESNLTYRYLRMAEHTWRHRYPQDAAFKETFPLNDEFHDYDWRCDGRQIMAEVNPAELTPVTNLLYMIYDSGVCLSLLFGLTLAEFTQNWFVLFVNPLINHRGRVLVTLDRVLTEEGAEKLRRRVCRFLRAQSCLPFAVWCALLLFLSANFLHLQGRLAGGTKRVVVGMLSYALLSSLLVTLLYHRKESLTEWCRGAFRSVRRHVSCLPNLEGGEADSQALLGA